MLSAVESHFGPGRPYTHHFAGQPIPSLLPPCPISALPVLNTAAAVAAMSAAEFARPHPKPRYNGGPTRNGLASPRSKYSEQSGPVNLAVSQSPMSLSLADAGIATQQTQPQPDTEVVSPSINSLYASHKLPYCSTQVTTNAYPPTFNYSSLYGRSSTIYGAAPLYSPHPLANRNALHHRPTYIPNQLDHFPTYLPSTILPPVAISSVQTSSSVNVPISVKTSLLVNDRSQPQIPTQSLQNVMQEKEKEGKVQSSSSNMITSNGKTVGFKVPSGKEGSLKHRILTRPYGEKDGKIKSSIHGTVVRSSNNNNAPTNFTKGSLIELANGELRPVEDMRTEDFVLSSNKNPDLQLADTTVVKIVNGPQNNVLITFSYNNNKFDMETTPEHPFFVYGHGWASFHPDGSLQVFGLKCKRLQVGDVCISLTPRETTTQSQTTNIQSSYYNPYSYSKEDLVQIPQNLSRKPQTIPTTATGTAVTSRPAPHFDVQQSLSAYTTFLNCSNTNNSNNGMTATSRTAEIRPHSNNSSSSSRPISLDGLSRAIPLHITDSSCMTKTGSPPASAIFSISTDEEDSALDATLSRKRRWSAPDNICDDENCQQTGQKNCNH